MTQYRVKADEGIILQNGVPFYSGDIIDLTEKEYEVVGNKVEPLQKEKSVDLNHKTVDELKTLAEAQGIEVVGTGKNGTIKKADYIAALEK